MKNYMKQLIALTAAALGLAATPLQAAVILLEDNFDTDSAITVLNFNAFNNWTVSDGTVDYLRSGGISCMGGAGGCVDLDGSSVNGGRMTSIASFTLLPGESYLILVDVSGNQRGGAADDITFGLLGFTSLSILNILPTAPFSTKDLGFSPVAAVTGQLFIETSSADNVGVIVDNVRFECLTCQNGSAMPEPGALALLGLGLLGVVGFARKRG